uniref:Uncharacterized protein n=1 Tax=Zea mays TaxID=4577 RepID=B4FK64_MAIZE|nr:unknown [Zea mays]
MLACPFDEEVHTRWRWTALVCRVQFGFCQAVG